MHYGFFKIKKKNTKFRILSNNKYRWLNLEKLIDYINYTLIEDNHIILKRALK